MIRYEISTNPECFGSDATEEEAAGFADKIAEKAGELFPDACFEIVSGAPREDCLDEEKDDLAEITQVINDNWAEWVSE